MNESISVYCCSFYQQDYQSKIKSDVQYNICFTLQSHD